MYSKLETNRHVQPGEVVGLINKMVEGLGRSVMA